MHAPRNLWTSDVVWQCCISLIASTLNLLGLLPLAPQIWPTTIIHSIPNDDFSPNRVSHTSMSLCKIPITSRKCSQTNCLNPSGLSVSSFSLYKHSFIVVSSKNNLVLEEINSFKIIFMASCIWAIELLASIKSVNILTNSSGVFTVSSPTILRQLTLIIAQIEIIDREKSPTSKLFCKLIYYRSNAHIFFCNLIRWLQILYKTKLCVFLPNSKPPLRLWSIWTL